MDHLQDRSLKAICIATQPPLRHVLYQWAPVLQCTLSIYLSSYVGAYLYLPTAAHLIDLWMGLRARLFLPLASWLAWGEGGGGGASISIQVGRLTCREAPMREGAKVHQLAAVRAPHSLVLEGPQSTLETLLVVTRH